MSNSSSCPSIAMLMAKKETIDFLQQTGIDRSILERYLSGPVLSYFGKSDDGDEYLSSSFDDDDGGFYTSDVEEEDSVS
jgi:hypothetical protein